MSALAALAQQELDETRRENARLLSLVAELQKDVVRYRWLRDTDHWKALPEKFSGMVVRGVRVGCYYDGSCATTDYVQSTDLDAAIDAALKQGGGL